MMNEILAYLHVACLLVTFSVKPVLSILDSNIIASEVNSFQARIDLLPIVNINSSSNHSSICSNDLPRGSCPPALFCDEGYCKCGHYPHDIIKCDEEKGTSAVLDCYCATFVEGKNATVAGACVYNCDHYPKTLRNFVYHSLPNDTENNNTICAPLNRTGMLCGRCLPEHYPLAYSFNLTCIKCPHVGWNWGRYLMAAYLPLMLFCFFIFFLKINAVTSHLLPVIVYSQAISVPAMSRVVLIAIHTQPSYLLGAKILLSFYGIWNLDIFKPFYSDICLGLGPLPILALEYAIAVYPFLLMAVSYLLIKLYDKNCRVILVMWKPFKVIFSLFKKNWNIKTSLIDCYATFFFLSNVKFLSVTFDLLTPTQVYELHRDGYNQTLGLYYAGDIEYFGKEHLPYGILAMIISIVFIILPIALLALYPFAFFQRLLNCIPIRWHILHTFMDSFNGCYKDGTEPGTRDCRWFASVFLNSRLFLFIIFAFVHTSIYFAFGAILLLVVVLLIINVQPFKAPVAHYSKINATFFILLSLLYLTLCGFELANIKVHQLENFFYVITAIFMIVPLAYTVIIVTYWIFTHRRFGLKLANRIRAWKNGYRGLDNDTDDLIEHVRPSDAKSLILFSERSCSP